MKATEETLKQIQENLGHDVPVELISMIVAKMPEDANITTVIPILKQALQKLPQGLTPQQMMTAMGKGIRKDHRMDGKPGNAKETNRKYLDSIWLEQRIMDPAIPSTEMNLFGKSFVSPIMTAALSHLGRNNTDPDSAFVQYAKGASKAGVVHWVGMCENEELDAIAATGAHFIRIVKPYADEEKLFSQLYHTKKMGALAVGMDIDHTFDDDGTPMVVMGQQMALKSLRDMKNYCNATDLPFIVKGVLSVKDAVRCAEIGAAGIVVSHHGGHFPYAVPPLMILPDILRELNGSMKVFVDSGIASGADAYKALALGADAVSVGTALLPHLKKGGAAAVGVSLKEMNDELRYFMANTGVRNTSGFDPSVLHFHTGA